MSKELQIFENPEFGRVRTVQVNNETWLVGKDIAVALRYQNPSKALSDHVDEEDKGVTKCYTPGGVQEMTIINESGLYSLVLSSKLPTAKRFRRWVTKEVLPSIRRTGGYLAGANSMTPAELMAKALTVAQKTLADREARISALTVENQIMKPKADYFDALCDQNHLTSFRQTAQLLLVGEKTLINWLVIAGYLYRDKNGKLVPYARKNKGLFEVKEIHDNKTGWCGTQTLVTTKGREMMHRELLGLD